MSDTLRLFGPRTRRSSAPASSRSLAFVADAFTARNDAFSRQSFCHAYVLNTDSELDDARAVQPEMHTDGKSENISQTVHGQIRGHKMHFQTN